MADKKAVASGLWSDTATWDGGALPGTTDDVYANNFTVDIDQTILVNSLRTVAGTGISAGGEFIVTAAATVTVTAGLQAAHNTSDYTYLLTVNAGSASVSLVVPGGIVGGAGNGRTPLATTSGYAGTLTITGNLTGGSGLACNAFYNEGDCTIAITGNLMGGSGGSTAAIFNDGGATFTLTGDATGGAGSEAHGFFGDDAAMSLTVNGTVTGGTADDSNGVQVGFGAVTIRGTIRPGDNIIGAPGLVTALATMCRVSGTIAMGGTTGAGGSSAKAAFPIWGPWTKIDGETLELLALDDADFPTSNAGDEVSIGSGGGAEPPTSGVGWPPRYYA